MGLQTVGVEDFPVTNTDGHLVKTSNQNFFIVVMVFMFTVVLASLQRPVFDAQTI